jgi:hypothetical protein
MGVAWPTSLSESTGVVEGRLQSVSTDGVCTLVVEDRRSGRPVVGYLGEGICAAARELVDQDVVVHGRVQRETATGIAVAVRDVTEVAAVPLRETDPLAFRKLRGILGWQEGDPLPEERIREMRGG